MFIADAVLENYIRRCRLWSKPILTSSSVSDTLGLTRSSRLVRVSLTRCTKSPTLNSIRARLQGTNRTYQEERKWPKIPYEFASGQ